MNDIARGMYYLFKTNDFQCAFPKLIVLLLVDAAFWLAMPSLGFRHSPLSRPHAKIDIVAVVFGG